MSELRGIDWIALAILGLMALLTVRKLRDVRLWSITSFVICSTVEFRFAYAVSKGEDFVGVNPIWSLFIMQATDVVGAYCLLCFFLFSTFDAHQASARARRQAVVVAGVVVVLVAAIIMIPPDLRVAAIKVMTAKESGPNGVFSIGLFYTTANCYLVYAYVRGGVSTGRSARHAEGRLRFALVVATAGLALLALAQAILAASSSSRWVGTSVPVPVRASAVSWMLLGAALLLIGLGYPAVATRAAAGGIWWHHLHVYHALGPLWRILHEEFPEDALARTSINPRLDLLHLTGVHRRFYRRVIECRDGLVRISPYIAKARDDGLASAVLAVQLTAALDLRAAGEPVGEAAVEIAPPTSAGLDADVDALVALSQDLVSTKGFQ